jgi:hypothetical protein
MKENYFKSRIFYPENLSFINEVVIKNIHDKYNLKQYMTTKSALLKILKGI